MSEEAHSAGAANWRVEFDSMPECSASNEGAAESRTRVVAWLVITGAVSAALYAATYAPLSAGRGAPSIGLRLVTYPLLFVAYFAASFVVWRERERAFGRAATIVALALAIAFRAIVLSGPVANNTDNWRYLWEGKVLLSGANPYAAPPASPKYDDLRAALGEVGDDLFERLPRRLLGVRSVYGPVATAIFALPHFLPFDRIWSLRLIMTAFDVGTTLVLMGLLRSLRRAPALALIYAWNPMCLSGFADRAHIDAPMVLFVALAAWLMCARRPGWSGVALAVALLVKVSPFPLAVPFARMGRGRFAGPMLALLAVGAAPFVLAGEGSLSGFQAFANKWHNMDSMHALLLAAVWPARSALDVERAARFIVTLAAACFAVWRTFRGTGEGSQWFLETCAHVSAAAILLSPVVHPWYTAHMLVFLCFAPNPGLLLLTCATMAWFLRFWEPAAESVFGRLLAAVQQYREPWRWVAYPPVYALLLISWLRGRRRGRAAATRSC